jgi:hypothetical protein
LRENPASPTYRVIAAQVYLNLKDPFTACDLIADDVAGLPPPPVVWGGLSSSQRMLAELNIRCTIELLGPESAWDALRKKIILEKFESDTHRVGLKNIKRIIY